MYLNILRSICSLKKRDDYPMYSMTYYGDYGFDGFLEQGATNDDDLLCFVQSRVTSKKKIVFDTPKSGCTTFIAKESNGDVLYARNYDFPPTAFVVVKTKPKNGYASVSIVDLMALGFSKANPPIGFTNKLPLLATPYLPFDGMNEKGLAVAVLQVPKTDLPNDPSKITLNTTTLVRLMLDKAATIDEAVAAVSRYNVYFSIGVYCHYFVADASGKSVIIEFCDGKTHVTEENTASNFYACSGLTLGHTNEKPSPRERYDMVKKALAKGNGVMSMTEAGSLLCDVGIYSKDESILQWSAVYNLSALTGMVFPGRDMSKTYRFDM